VTGTPWNPGLFANPVHLATSTITRDPGSPSSGLKSLGYLDSILAAREAREQGGDDAILLTPAGRVACTTIANVFVLSGDRVMTPPLGDAVQPGIMRHLVLDAATRLGLDAVEQSLTLRDLRAADQVFLTNSVRFLCPCPTLDGDALDRRGEEILDRLTDAICGQVLEACGFELRSGHGSGPPNQQADESKRSAAAGPA
jgi:branched-chain amino acid aminotransferase